MKIFCCKILRLDVKNYNIKARYTVSSYRYVNSSPKKVKVSVLILKVQFKRDLSVHKKAYGS